jgi:hypothetical protein
MHPRRLPRRRAPPLLELPAATRLALPARWPSRAFVQCGAAAAVDAGPPPLVKPSNPEFDWINPESESADARPNVVVSM